MHTVEEARELAKELALELEEFSQVEQQLREKGYGGLLSDEELEQIMLEAKTSKHLNPNRNARKKRTVPIIVGALAIMLGVTALIVTFGSQDMPGGRRNSPAGFGIIAIVLGICLIFFPGFSDEEI